MITGKKIDEVSQLITELSDKKFKDGNNIDERLSLTKNQEKKLDQFDSNLEDADE